MFCEGLTFRFTASCKPLIINKFAIYGLLRCERCPFALSFVPFYAAKCRLS